MQFVIVFSSMLIKVKFSSILALMKAHIYTAETFVTSFLQRPAVIYDNIWTKLLEFCALKES